MEDSFKSVKLFVATPCFGGMVSHRYMQCMLALFQYTAASGIHLQLETLGYESLITRGRNTLVAKFLDDPSLTHFMFIDADIGFEPQQILRMIRFDEDVVAGMYPLKLIDWTPEALKRIRCGESIDVAPLRFVGTPCEGREFEQRDEFITGSYAGTGFMLIRRSVFETMFRNYPHLRYAAAHNAAEPSRSPNQYALFDCIIDARTGEYLSEDYAFCQRWRALGGKIWLDTASRLAHIGAHEFFGSPKPRFSTLPS